MNFTFRTPSTIIFGAGSRNEHLETLMSLGDTPFIVTGSLKPGVSDFSEEFAQRLPGTIFFRVSGEPSIPLVNRALHKARENGCDCVIALGGGSVIDTGKAVAALLTNGDDCLEFLEVVGKGKPLARAPLPLAALPTTAGTGSEVTKNAVISCPEHNVKVSMRSPLMIPRYAIVDPELTLTMPPEVTAATGLDALTQLIEAYITRNRNPATDGFCREGIAMAAVSLKKAYEDGSDLEARTDMSCAGLFGGIALANAGLGAVHGFAGPIGGMFNIPHGLICAVLLPHVYSANLRSGMTCGEDSDLGNRFKELAVLLTGRPDASKEDGALAIASLCEQLGVPRLSDFGIRRKDFPDIQRKAACSSSMKGNPVDFSERELHDILEEAF